VRQFCGKIVACSGRSWLLSPLAAAVAIISQAIFLSIIENYFMGFELLYM
jgi:hypothetical protein